MLFEITGGLVDTGCYGRQFVSLVRVIGRRRPLVFRRALLGPIARPGFDARNWESISALHVLITSRWEDSCTYTPTRSAARPNTRLYSPNVLDNMAMWSRLADQRDFFSALETSGRFSREMQPSSSLARARQL